MSDRRRAADQWTLHDTALWHTVDILAAYLTGDLDRRPPALTSFAPAFGPDERTLVEGPFQLFHFAAAGGDSFFVGGSGALGLALVAGSVLHSVNRNQQRWRLADSGQLVVSTSGFYLASRQGLRPWSWAAVDGVTVSGPRSVTLQGRTDHGAAVSWAVNSDWSELLFVLWALTRHRRHPQLIAGSWLPPGWRERAEGHGYPPQSRLVEIDRALGSGER